ncbi:MAG: LysR family transcriptional regulator [bacterium]|nr:LysR family transcriptional regulator [bacterium]
MDLKKMEYFMAAAEEGTFTKAANRCYISQTAISQQIAGLEKELEVTLFDRSNYRPKLTPAGSKFYESCKQLFEQLDQAIKEVKALDRVNKKSLNIGVTGSYERIMLTPLLREYVKVHPEITINLIEHDINENVKLLKEGDVDVLFVLIEDMKNQSNLEIHQLFIKRICIITPIEHRLADRKEVKGSDLKDEQFIVFSPKVSPNVYNSFINACKRDGYTPNIAQKVDSPYDIAIMVSLGKGIAISSEEIRLDDNMLRTVRLVDSAHQGEYCLVKTKKNTNKEVADFIDISIRECRKG